MKNLKRIGELINHLDALVFEIKRNTYLDSERGNPEVTHLENRLAKLGMSAADLERELIEFLADD